VKGEGLGIRGAGSRVRGITAAMPSIPTMTRICLGQWKIYRK
jgi:hypothetical protein